MPDEDNMHPDKDDAEAGALPYQSIDSIDFSRMTMGLKRLSFFADDTFVSGWPTHVDRMRDRA